MGGSKAPSNVTQTNKVELSPEQKKLFDLALPYINQYAEQEPSMYGGDLLAGFDPNEQQAHAGYLAAADRFRPMADQAAQSNAFLMSPDQLDPNTNPYIRAIADQIGQGISSNVTNNVLPAVRAGGIQSGGMYSGGSTRQLMAEGLAGQGAADATGDALEKLYFNNYQNGLNTMGSAIGRNKQVGLDMLFADDVYSMVGAQKRGMTQAGMDLDFQKWALEQQLPFLKSQDIMGLINGMPGATGVSNVKGATPGGPSPVMGALCGAASGAALGAMTGMAGGGPIGAILGAMAGYFMSRQ